MSTQVRARLANFIEVITESEKQVEIVRQVLAEQKLFEPYTAFRRLDQRREGALKLNDILEFLNDNNIQPSREQARYLFERLDRDHDGLISYNDLNKALVTKDNPHLRERVMLRDSYFIDVNMLLPSEVEWALARLFDTEINNYQIVQNALDRLLDVLDESNVNALRNSDLFSQGMMTSESLQTFMKQQGLTYLAPDAQSFLRSINDADLISHKDFFSWIFSMQQSSQEQRQQYKQETPKNQQPNIDTKPFEYSFEKKKTEQDQRPRQIQESKHYDQQSTKPIFPTDKTKIYQSEDIRKEQTPQRAQVAQPTTDMLSTLIRERERELERTLARSKHLDYPQIPQYYQPMIVYPVYPTGVYDPRPIMEAEAELLRRSRLATLEAEQRLLDMEIDRRSVEQDRILRDKRIDLQERLTRSQIELQTSELQRSFHQDDDRIRRLMKESRIIDNDIQNIIARRRQHLEELRHLNPEEQFRYFDPEGNYPFGIIEAINRYDPLGNSPNKYPSYSGYNKELSPDKLKKQVNNQGQQQQERDISTSAFEVK